MSIRRLRQAATRARPARLLALGALLVCTACPGSLEDPGLFVEGDAGSGCPDIPTQVFLPDCAGSGCHSAASSQAGLDLESPDVASRLVGVPATGGRGVLVDPADPTASVLYEKLTPTPPFGARMPFIGQPLDDATMACVLDWISQLQGPDASSVDGGGSPPPDAGGDAGPSGSRDVESGADGSSIPPNGL
jgi:hypothetical protein